MPNDEDGDFYGASIQNSTDTFVKSTNVISYGKILEREKKLWLKKAFMPHLGRDRPVLVVATNYALFSNKDT